MKYSPSKENYLKAIFHLQHDQQSVSTNALAEALQTKPASVTDMLKKLKEQKLLQYEKYRGVKLTTEGKKIAIHIIRKHRLWEFFLVEKLGFGWEEVHEIAEEMEHISSKKLIDRLDEYLNFPQTDPHGDPIPDMHGRIPVNHNINLTALPLHTPAEVTSFSNQSAELMELLNHKHIRLGTRLEVKKKFLYDQSLDIKIRNQPSFTISAELAACLFVKFNEQPKTAKIKSGKIRKVSL